VQKRVLAELLCTGFEVPRRRACQVLAFARSCYYYRNHADPQVELRIRLKDLAGTRVRYGYRRLHVLLMREGWQINHKRVYRLYKQEGLSLRLKTKKKRLSQARVPLCAPSGPKRLLEHEFRGGSTFRWATISTLDVSG
jgi:putative transposase